MFKLNNKVKDIVLKKNRIPRIVSVILGAFICAVVYNSFNIPNNVVSGGGGGLAIIFNKMFGIPNIVFLDIFVGISLIFSFIFLGKKHIVYSTVGYLAYTIMLNLTSPIAHYFVMNFDSYLFTVFIYGLLNGIGSALIFRAGFNTGGIDSYIEIFMKKFKVPYKLVSNIINGIIILIGAIYFGLVNTIYTIIFLVISNFICDYFELGNSTNKLCYISTSKQKELEYFLTNELKVSYNIIFSSNGILIFKKDIIMCVVPTDMFYVLKEKLKSLDPNCTLYSEDCYTVYGGVTNNILPV